MHQVLCVQVYYYNNNYITVDRIRSIWKAAHMQCTNCYEGTILPIIHHTTMALSSKAWLWHGIKMPQVYIILACMTLCYLDIPVKFTVICVGVLLMILHLFTLYICIVMESSAPELERYSAISRLADSVRQLTFKELLPFTSITVMLQSVT